MTRKPATKRNPASTDKLPEGLRRLPSGRIQWRAQVTLANGTVRSLRGSADTIREAVRDRELQREDALRGRTVAPAEIKLSELFETFMTEIEPEYSWSYVQGLRSIFRIHIEPRLGHRKVQSIVPDNIKQLYLNVRQSDPRPGSAKRFGQPLSISMRKKIKTLITQLLDQAMREEIIVKNPARLVRQRMRRVEQHPDGVIPRAWTFQEAQAFYKVARSYFKGQPFCFQLATGMRIGEVLALQWTDVDLDTGEVRIHANLGSQNGKVVRGTVKTPEAIRTILVSGDALQLLKEQARWQRLIREAGHKRYQPPATVFCNIYGGPQSPDNVYRSMKQICEEARVPYRGTHVLRHTYVTQQFAQGVDGVLLSRQVGHADPSFTARVYRTDNLQERAHMTLDFSDEE